METNKISNIAKTKIKFKSYYVVWKQEGTSIRLKLGACLNRTMQYGNYTK